jgi:hypothetical protein
LWRSRRGLPSDLNLQAALLAAAESNPANLKTASY